MSWQSCRHKTNGRSAGKLSCTIKMTIIRMHELLDGRSAPLAGRGHVSLTDSRKTKPLTWTASTAKVAFKHTALPGHGDESIQGLVWADLGHILTTSQLDALCKNTKMLTANCRQCVLIHCTLFANSSTQKSLRTQQPEMDSYIMRIHFPSPRCVEEALMHGTTLRKHIDILFFRP